MTRQPAVENKVARRARMVRRLADVMDTEGMSEVTVMLSEAAMLVANTAKRNGDDLKHATWNALANDLREGVEEERDARG